MGNASPPDETQPDARFWDRGARRYAARPISDPEGYARTLAAARARLSPEDRVLELGCGSGDTARALAGAVRLYRATDISAAMIAVAEERQADPPLPGLSFAIGTAGEIEPPAGGFDAVLALNYLHLVRDLPATLGRIHDLLAPGGLFLSKTPCLADMNPLVGHVLLPILRAVGRAPHVLVFGEADLASGLREAGFDLLAVEHHAGKGRDTRPFVVGRRRS